MPWAQSWHIKEINITLQGREKLFFCGTSQLIVECHFNHALAQSARNNTLDSPSLEGKKIYSYSSSSPSLYLFLSLSTIPSVPEHWKQLFLLIKCKRDRPVFIKKFPLPPAHPPSMAATLDFSQLGAWTLPTQLEPVWTPAAARALTKPTYKHWEERIDNWDVED